MILAVLWLGLAILNCRLGRNQLGAKVVPLHEELFAGAGRVLYPLLEAVVFVLLIACANVANLFQSRTESRRKEYALRASLGAGWGRLMQQLFVESGLIALIGGLLGVLLSFGGIRIFLAMAGDFPNSETVSVDGRVLLGAGRPLKPLTGSRRAPVCRDRGNLVCTSSRD